MQLIVGAYPNRSKNRPPGRIFRQARAIVSRGTGTHVSRGTTSSRPSSPCHARVAGRVGRRRDRLSLVGGACSISKALASAREVELEDSRRYRAPFIRQTLLPALRVDLALINDFREEEQTRSPDRRKRIMPRARHVRGVFVWLGSGRCFQVCALRSLSLAAASSGLREPRSPTRSSGPQPRRSLRQPSLQKSLSSTCKGIVAYRGRGELAGGADR